jgi:hypothetical protein
MEVKEGNVVSSFLATVITTELSQSIKVSVVTIDVTPLAPITIFVEKEVVIGEDLDIVEDNDKVVQGVIAMHSIGEGDKEHLFSKVLPAFFLVDLD